MGRLTTHVLDTASGRPAAGLVIELWRPDDNKMIKTATTNADGRLDRPIIDGEAFTAGVYELRFRAGDYLRAAGLALAEPAFFDLIPVRFGIADPTQHYHVPMLLSPYGYSTYRGS